MLKMRITEYDLLESESVAPELYGSPEEKLQRDLRNLFLAYSTEPVPQHVVGLAQSLENALCAAAAEATDEAADHRQAEAVSEPRRLYH